MRSKGSCLTVPHHPIITAPTSLSFLHLLLINTQEWISRVIKSSALPAKSLIVLIVNPDQMLVKIKLEKWLGQVPPPAFQGCDSLQHPSPLSQLFSARLCSFGRNSSSHCGIWHGTCGHGRHRAMGDGVSSPPWPRSLRRGLPKGRFPDCGVECAAPPEVWRTELSICKQAASILGQLGTACQEMGFRWEGSPCSPFYNLISVCVWIDFPPLSKFFCLFLNPNYSLYQVFHELVWLPSAQSTNSSKI